MCFFLRELPLFFLFILFYFPVTLGTEAYADASVGGGNEETAIGRQVDGTEVARLMSICTRGGASKFLTDRIVFLPSEQPWPQYHLIAPLVV